MLYGEWTPLAILVGVVIPSRPQLPPQAEGNEVFWGIGNSLKVIHSPSLLLQLPQSPTLSHSVTECDRVEHSG